MGMTVYTAATLLDGTGTTPIRDPWVLVEKGRIIEIGSGPPPGDGVEGTKRVDYAGATLLPGLVDAHLHLCLALKRDDWHTVKSDAPRLALIAAEAARETLRAGVTTVADCGARYGVTQRLRDAIAARELPGSRIWACGTWLTVTNGHGYFWTEWGLDSGEALRQGLRQMVWEGADFIKIMASGGSTHGGKTNRRRAQYSAAELRMAVEDAHRLNKRVHCHVNATEAMRVCIEAGVDVVEHCNWLGAEPGTVEYDGEVAALGGARGVYAGINGDGPFALLGARDGRAQEWGQATRWDLMRRMQEAGMRIFIDTDAISGGWDSLPRIMQRMVDEGKASAMETVGMSTLVPAQALGLDDRLGSLEPGKLADMLVVPGDPLADMSVVTRPLVVIKEGRIAVENRTILC